MAKKGVSVRLKGGSMKKVLDKIKNKLFHYDDDGWVKDGPHADLSGDCTGLSGDCSGLSGDCSGLSGDCSGLSDDCSGLRGDCSGLSGNCTGLSGNLDLANITDKERTQKINIQTLVKEEPHKYKCLKCGRMVETKDLHTPFECKKCRGG